MTWGTFDRSPTPALLPVALAVLLLIRPTTRGYDAEPPRRVVDYAPAVRIDWPNGSVEVDGKVVLREGMLELFACSPNTREHESIVVLNGRPRRIYEALGLIGLTPGRPVRFDEQSKQWLPPTGDAVRIEVRWEQDGKTKRTDIGSWMRDTKTGQTVPPGVWVFAGSYRTDGNELAADQEGTVVCVVDFSSALIALPELHSADNDALQLRANTARVPPIGTAVTLLFWGVEPARLEIEIGAEGQIRYGRQELTTSRLVARVRRFQRDHTSAVVAIKIDPHAPADLVKEVEEAVRQAVKPGTEVRVTRRDKKAKVDRPRSDGDSEQP